MSARPKTGGPPLTVAADGWVCGARRDPSPNFDARPTGSAIELLVVHNISLPPGVFGSGDIARLFTNRLDAAAHPFFATLAGVRVSAHFLIERDGGLSQFVSCLDRAWHAGASEFEG
ncbi:MAG: 1,6-anhydro-N-acetylmuramyl-L-alanine amidase AmpD, partial [Burkholderiaceae bacterium]